MTIYWGDETAVAVDGYWVRGYAPASQTPVLTTPGHRSGSALVTTRNPGLRRFHFIEQAMNAELLIEFLGQLTADNTQKVFLVLDNLEVHHAKAVTRCVGGDTPNRSSCSICRPTSRNAIPPNISTEI